MREQSKPDLVVGHGASTIGTPDYVPPNELAKLREAVPRAVNALADAMEQLERQRPVVEAARGYYQATACGAPHLANEFLARLLLAVEAMQKAQKGGSDV